MSRKEVLSKALGELDLSNDQEFYRLLVTSCSILGMSERVLAEAFDVSDDILTRWLDGAFLPHPSMRAPIVAWLQGYLEVPMRPRNKKRKEISVKVTSLRATRLAARKIRLEKRDYA